MLTRGQLISKEIGLKLENVTVEQPGQAERVVIDKDTTTIVGGRGNKKLIAARRANPPRDRRREPTAVASSVWNCTSLGSPFGCIRAVTLRSVAMEVSHIGVEQIENQKTRAGPPRSAEQPLVGR